MDIAEPTRLQRHNPVTRPQPGACGRSAGLNARNHARLLIGQCPAGPVLRPKTLDQHIVCAAKLEPARQTLLKRRRARLTLQKPQTAGRGPEAAGGDRLGVVSHELPHETINGGRKRIAIGLRSQIEPGEKPEIINLQLGRMPDLHVLQSDIGPIQQRVWLQRTERNQHPVGGKVGQALADPD